MLPNYHVTKLSSYQTVGCQIVSYQKLITILLVTKMLVTQLLVTENPPILKKTNFQLEIDEHFSLSANEQKCYSS